jgi:uncharacterized membrane protein
MNPSKWKRDYQVAFVGATIFGASMGVFIGLRQTAATDGLHLTLWGIAGAALGAAGAFIRQLMRNRNIN